MTTPARNRELLNRAIRRGPGDPPGTLDVDAASTALEADLIAMRAADNAAPVPVDTPTPPTR